MKDEKMFETDPVTGKKKYIKGSWKKMLKPDYKTIIIIVLASCFLGAWKAEFKECRGLMETVANNPCTYCSMKTLNISSLNESNNKTDFEKFYREIQNRPGMNFT